MVSDIILLLATSIKLYLRTSAAPYTSQLGSRKNSSVELKNKTQQYADQFTKTCAYVGWMSVDNQFFD